MSSPILSETINAAIESALTLPEEERLAVLVACDKLKAKLENPVEKTMRIVFAVSATLYFSQFHPDYVQQM